MKTIILLVVGMLWITQYTCSQGFISEDKQWNVKHYFWGDIYTEIFKIEGDTLINSVNYQKVWHSFDSTLVDWSLTAFIREDSNVVYLLTGNEYEGILYDFNLEAGDTANIVSLICPETQVVIDDIDTINYFGIDRKRWLLDWTSEYWIEGIGSNFGPFYSLYDRCSADLGFSLLCFYQNDTLCYINPYEDDCYQFYVGIDGNPTPKTQITLSPNPASTFISITLPPTTPVDNTTLCIYNVSARQVLSRRITEPITVIDINNLPSGVYFARVASDKTVYYGRFIKQ